MPGPEFARERKELIEKLTAYAEKVEGKPLSRSKWAHLASLYTGPDGRLDESELEKLIRDAGVADVLSGLWADEIMYRADIDQNATIDLDELMRVLADVPTQEDLDHSTFWGALGSGGMRRVDELIHGEFEEPAAKVIEKVPSVSDIQDTAIIAGGVVLLLILFTSK